MAETATNTDSEIWKDIEGWPNYQVSNMGRVRVAERIRVQPHPRNKERLTKVTYPARIRKQSVCPQTGYKKVGLSQPGLRRTMAVHVLVCAAFNGPKPPKHDAAHWNGDRSDNRAVNLRWATRKDNAADRLRHGTEIFGERNGQSKLTDAQFEEIKRRRAGGEMLKDLAAEFGVWKTHLSARLNGRTRRNR